MTSYYLDLGIASDWLKQISLAARPIRSTTQIWVVKRHQYGISALVLQTSFRGENSGSVANCSSVKHEVLWKKCTLFEFQCISHLVLIEDTVFTSPTGDGTAILRGHPSYAKVFFPFFFQS